MSLRDTINNAIKQAMVALDDVPESCTYTSVTSSSYTASSGTVTMTSVSYTGVPILFDTYQRREIDGSNIRPADQKAIFASLHLTATPSLNDSITRPDGTVWVVVAIETDPSGAHWELQVRRP